MSTARSIPHLTEDGRCPDCRSTNFRSTGSEADEIYCTRCWIVIIDTREDHR